MLVRVVEQLSVRPADVRPRWGLAAVVLAVPAALFVAANILKFNLHAASLYDALGFLTRPHRGVAGLVRDGVVVFGALASLALSLFATTRARISLRGGLLSGAISLRLSAPHVVALALSGGSLVAMAVYLTAENILA